MLSSRDAHKSWNTSVSYICMALPDAFNMCDRGGGGCCTKYNLGELYAFEFGDLQKGSV